MYVCVTFELHLKNNDGNEFMLLKYTFVLIIVFLKYSNIYEYLYFTTSSKIQLQHEHFLR